MRSSARRTVGVGRAPRHAVPGDVAAYVCVTVLATWAVVGPLVAVRFGWLDTAPAQLHALGALGPTIGAVTVLAATGGRRAVADLARRTTDVRRVSAGWWLLAVSPLGFAAAAVAVAALLGGLRSAEPSVLAAGLGVSLAYGVFEEIGWRGFLLPRLQARQPAIVAAGWTFVVWAAWHLPMFAYRLPGGIVALGWLIGLYFGSVWLAVVHNGTRGSVLACIVWHVCYDVASTGGAQVSDAIPAAVTVLVVIGTLIAVRRVGVPDLGTPFAIDAQGHRVQQG
jgi:membrane protease YdiL (CAAX protease family)